MIRSFLTYILCFSLAVPAYSDEAVFESTTGSGAPYTSSSAPSSSFQELYNLGIKKAQQCSKENSGVVAQVKLQASCSWAFVKGGASNIGGTVKDVAHIGWEAIKIGVRSNPAVAWTEYAFTQNSFYNEAFEKAQNLGQQSGKYFEILSKLKNDENYRKEAMQTVMKYVPSLLGDAAKSFLGKSCLDIQNSICSAVGYIGIEVLATVLLTVLTAEAGGAGGAAKIGLVVERLRKSEKIAQFLDKLRDVLKLEKTTVRVASKTDEAAKAAEAARIARAAQLAEQRLVGSRYVVKSKRGNVYTGIYQGSDDKFIHLIDETTGQKYALDIERLDIESGKFFGVPSGTSTGARRSASAAGRADEMASIVRDAPAYTSDWKNAANIREINGQNRRIIHDITDRKFAVSEGRLFEGVSLDRLPKGHSYTYVVTNDGQVVYGRVDNALEYGVKHFQLANGRPVVAAGELRIDAAGKITYNVESGSFTLKLIERGVPESQIAQTAERVLRAQGAREVGYTKQVLIPSRAPNAQELIQLCKNPTMKMMFRDLCGN